MGSHLVALSFSKRLGKHPSVKILSTTFSIGAVVVVGIAVVEVLLGKQGDGTVEFIGTELLVRQMSDIFTVGTTVRAGSFCCKIEFSRPQNFDCRSQQDSGTGKSPGERFSSLGIRKF